MQGKMKQAACNYMNWNLASTPELKAYSQEAFLTFLINIRGAAYF